MPDKPSARQAQSTLAQRSFEIMLLLAVVVAALVVTLVAVVLVVVVVLLLLLVVVVVVVGLWGCGVLVSFLQLRAYMFFALVVPFTLRVVGWC